MQKYDGQVVHQVYDQDGLIEIVEKEGVRSLHFGTHSRQSSMLLSDPNHLYSRYAQAMMGLLLFHDRPNNILMIGLGGGTITKYLLHQFPGCNIKVIEFRNSVLKIARSHFSLPRDARLKIKIGCGGDYVSQQSKINEEIHDLLLIDAFNHEGMATEVSSLNFFDGCRTLLKEDGLLAINLWGTNKDLFQQVAWNMGTVFEWRILFLPVRQRGNIIGFAFQKKAPKYSLKELRKKATQLEQKYHIDFPTFVGDIKKNNTTVLDKVLKQ